MSATTQADIARALGLSRAAVCKAVAKGMPTDSIEAARTWRQARPRLRLSRKERIEVSMTPPAIMALPPPEVATKVATESATPAEAEAGGFDELMVTQAESVLRSAFQLYQEAILIGNGNAVAQALRNWGEAGKAAASIRERFLATREKARQLVDIDEVMAGVGIEVCEWRRLFDTLGTRLAGGRISAEAAKEVQIEIERVKRDLMPRAAVIAKALFSKPDDPEPDAAAEE
jgi:hypothetical protein